MFGVAKAVLRRVLAIVLLAFLFAPGAPFVARAQSDPLPAWNEGPVKRSIIEFVGRVTSDGGAEFVPRAQRVAVFDNDGTLWVEQPIYFQLAFAIDECHAAHVCGPQLHHSILMRVCRHKDSFMLNRIAMVLAAFVVACSLATPFAHADEDKLSKQELAQLLAPIALYPDDLLTNVLTGATIRSTSSKRRGGEGTATTPSFRVQH